MTHEKQMRKEQMTEYVKSLIAKHGAGHIISREKFIKGFQHIYKGVSESGIIPTDFCYNRVNAGTDWDNYPCLLEYLQKGLYKCLGLNYVYDGPILHQQKGKNKTVVGHCVNGKRTRIN